MFGNQTMMDLPPELPEGKKQLLKAALKLGAAYRGVSNLKLRELAREAKLNPNTFYRHFSDIEHIGQTVIQYFGDSLLSSLSKVRKEALLEIKNSEETELAFGAKVKAGGLATHKTLQHFFDFALENPEAIIIGVREYNGPSKVFKASLNKVINAIADSQADALIELDILPGMDEEMLRKISRINMVDVFLLAIDYIERPDDRKEIFQMCESKINYFLLGAYISEKMGF